LTSVNHLKISYTILYTMSDTAKLQQIRSKAVERQQRYYKAHKEIILQKKKVDRQLLKIINTPIQPVFIPTEFTLEMVIDVLTANITAENTRKKYINDVKRVFNLSGIQVFTGTMEEFSSIKKTVCESKYSLSTQRGTIQSILVFIEHSKLIIDKKILARYSSTGRL
jgi:hypothetical protein